MRHMKPADIFEEIVKTGIGKAESPLKKLIILGLFAGVYIAFAGAGANMAAYSLFGDPNT